MSEALPEEQTDRAHRATFTVTVTSRPDGGHYLDSDDFSAHAAQWLKAGMKDHHAIAEVTVAASLNPCATSTAAEEARRCAHTDIVYGQCIRPIPHDGECFHQHQPIRIDDETDEDSLCGNARPADDNFVGQLCGLPGGHFGDHRCDEEIAGTGHTALLRWRNGERP